MVLRVQDHVQGLLQALKFNSPSKIVDLAAYVSVYATFCRFQRFLECCKPLFDDLGTLFFDFQTWEKLSKGFARNRKGLGTWHGFFVWIGRGSLSWIC